MTALPAATAKKLGLVIDLDTCVGCQACATSCKEWNTGGYSAPLTDQEPYGADPHGADRRHIGLDDGGGAVAGRGRVVDRDTADQRVVDVRMGLAIHPDADRAGAAGRAAR